MKTISALLLMIIFFYGGFQRGAELAAPAETLSAESPQAIISRIQIWSEKALPPLAQEPRKSGQSPFIGR